MKKVKSQKRKAQKEYLKRLHKRSKRVSRAQWRSGFICLGLGLIIVTPFAVEIFTSHASGHRDYPLIPIVFGFFMAAVGAGQLMHGVYRRLFSK